MIRKALTPLFLCLGFLASPSLVAAQQPDRPMLKVGTVNEGTGPTIDGKVDDEVWMGVPPYSTFTQQEPNDGEPATERTEVRFLADRKNLYIGVIAFDREPDKIVVSQSRRDANLNDTDSIQILLDTLNDGQNGFVFGTNPYAIEYDGQVMNEGQSGGGGQGQGRGQGAGGSQGGQISGFNTNWDADWTVRAGITTRGWEAEFAIPLKTIRYRPGSNQTWGVNVMRNIRRRNEQAFMARVPRGYNLHRVSVAGKLTGLDLPVRRQRRCRCASRRRGRWPAPAPAETSARSREKTIAFPERTAQTASGLPAARRPRPARSRCSPSRPG